MKIMQYTYNYEPEMYKYILSTKILNKKKSEDKIFKKLVEGWNCEEISKKVHYSERTIQNRRKDIYNKTKKYMIGFITDEQKIQLFKNFIFVVYKLTFPNDKIYIGITSQPPKKRWKNGDGYVQNIEMYEDIQFYGWENIKKEILYENLHIEEALTKEKETIIEHKSNLKDYGYNKQI